MKPLIQLQIDFNLPYELTPCKKDLDYELKEYDEIHAPMTIIYKKKGGRTCKSKTKKG